MLAFLEKTYKFLSSPTTLFCMALIILVIYALRTETNFLNIKRVFLDYYKVFAGAKSHLLIFWGVPVLLAFASTQVALVSDSISENILVFLVL